jgi:hypothetical protein
VKLEPAAFHDSLASLAHGYITSGASAMIFM